MTTAFARPQPDEFQAGELAKGKTQIRWGISASWFSQGGIEWDGQQLAVVDADGERHPVALPPNGAQMVRLTFVYVENAYEKETWDAFVVDEQRHRLAELPSAGFEHGPALQELAQAAGLSYAEPRFLSTSSKIPFGYPPTDATLDLRKCVRSVNDHHGLGKLLHRGKGDSDQ